MVERFNARIAEVVNQTRFPSLQTLIDTLHNYVRTYNHAIPQRALKHLSPIAMLKEWNKKRPDLFLKMYTIIRVFTLSQSQANLRLKIAN